MNPYANQTDARPNMEQPEYVFATNRPVPPSGLNEGTILAASGAVVANGIASAHVVENWIETTAREMGVEIVRKESVASPPYCRYWGRTKAAETPSGMPCPDCADTDHPGLYIGLRGVEPCALCKGKKAI